MKSYKAKGSFLPIIPVKLLDSKTLVLLKSKSIKSQNGKTPVPPQTNITEPDGEMVSNFNPEPIGSDKMIYPLNLELQRYEVSSPFLYFLMIKGTISLSVIL